MTPPLTPGAPIPMMDEEALHAAEMEAEAALMFQTMAVPVRTALLRLLIGFREVRKGAPLIMPTDGVSDRNMISTARVLCGEVRG